MKIAIIGVGAMGCLFAARLSPLADVTMLGHWPEQLHTLQRRGLTLIEPSGEARQIRVKVTASTNGIELVDIAFVLVKSYQTDQAVAAVEQLLARDGIALTLQNGLGNLEKLAARVTPRRALLGATTEGATLEGPGVVRHAGQGTTYLAKAADRNLVVDALPELLRRAGFETVVSDDVDAILWAKLAVNAAINPLTALLRVRNGSLLQSTATRALMRAAADEVHSVAGAQNITLPEPNAADQAEEVARATARNRSSMLQDVLNGRPTELDAITAAVVRLGRAYNVPTPVNEALLELMRAQEAGADWRERLPALPISDPALRQYFAALKIEVSNESM